MAEHLRDRADGHEPEQLGEEEAAATPRHDLGRDQREQHQEVRRPEPRPRQRARPSASNTPIGVAISTSSAASFRLCSSAPAAWRCATPSRSRVARVPPQREAVPDAQRAAVVERELDGDQDRDDRPDHVAPGDSTRKRGLPHGLPSQPRSRWTGPKLGLGARAGGRRLASRRGAPSTPGGSSTCSSPSGPPGRRDRTR